MKINSHRNAGFSLLELLVVIFIIGISVRFVTLAFGDNQAERITEKSQQLAALIELAKEQAIFNSTEMGVSFKKNSYSFYSLNTVATEDKKEETIWQQVEGDRFLAERSLPDGLQYELYLEGTKVNFDVSESKEGAAPHIYILSDGSISPFELRLSDDSDHIYEMRMAENGEHEIVEVVSP